MRFPGIISLILLFAGPLCAQEFSLNRLPLNRTITVRILGCDKEYLHCYNLYGFEWKTPEDSLTGEFIVPKNADSFQNKEIISLKLCRVKEFAIMAGGQCRKLPVEIGLQLEYPGQEERIFLNFDPAGPDPIFIPCN